MPDSPFVSRAGLKLEHALHAFNVDVTGLTCADLGCNVGGFTDCLLRQGAKHVHAIDTGYGTLAWKLRSDERVTTLERTNALHIDPPCVVDLVVADLGWTKQNLALPACLKWIKNGHIITLVKPHYELSKEEKLVESVASGLSDEAVERVLLNMVELCNELQLEILGKTVSPIRGKKSSKKGQGNCEYLFHLKVTM